MTDQEIAELHAYTRYLWPSSPEVELRTLVRAWSRQLEDVPNGLAVAVVDQYATDGNRFPPPVGLIRQQALVLAAPAGAAPSPEQAWEEVQAKIRSVGLDLMRLAFCGPDCPGRDCEHHQLPTFSHPAIDAVVAGLGWRSLCESSEPMADRAHFLRMYGSAVERVVREVARPPSMVKAREQLGIGPSATPQLPAGSVLPAVSDDEDEPAVRLDAGAALEHIGSLRALKASRVAAETPEAT